MKYQVSEDVVSPDDWSACHSEGEARRSFRFSVWSQRVKKEISSKSVARAYCSVEEAVVMVPSLRRIGHLTRLATSLRLLFARANTCTAVGSFDAAIADGASIPVSSSASWHIVSKLKVFLQLCHSGHR